MAGTLYPLVNMLLKDHPELQRHRKLIVGGCCRSPDDRTMERRIRAFLISMPQFDGIFQPMLKSRA